MTTSNEYPNTSAQIVTPPSSLDGPTEPVDWRELEDADHPIKPIVEDAEDEDEE